MTILVTGSTGRIGAQVVTQLARSGRHVRALTRSPEKAQFPAALPRVTCELCGPDALTGASLAALRSEALGRDVRYAGNDLDTFENNVKTRAPAWMAYDMRAMMRRYQHDGAVATPEDLDRLTTLLGRPPRRYRDFAAETAQVWQQ